MKICVEASAGNFIEALNDLEYDEIINIIKQLELYISDCEFTEKLLDYFFELESDYEKDCNQVAPE